MPFAAWIHADDLAGTQSGIIFTGFAVIAFIWIYVRTARSFRKAASERLERLRQTLDPYCRAAGMLSGDADAAPDEAEHEPEPLHLLLQQCKAAPLVTTEMIEAIDAYARDRDASRHAQLERLLDREIKKKSPSRLPLSARWTTRGGERPFGSSCGLRCLFSFWLASSIGAWGFTGSSMIIVSRRFPGPESSCGCGMFHASWPSFPFILP